MKDSPPLLQVRTSLYADGMSASTVLADRSRVCDAGPYPINQLDKDRKTQEQTCDREQLAEH